MLTRFEPERRAVALAPAAPRPVMSLQPFGLGPDPHFIYRSDPYIWAFEQTMTAVRRREGLVLVTGEPGTGKTLFCRTLFSKLSGRHAVSVILDPCVGFEELLLQVLRDFGVLPDIPETDGLRRHELIATLHRYLASLIPLDTTAVLVIDEAQHLRPEVLEQLRLLSNCESDHAKLLQIVLVGTTELEEICRSERLRHLDQRVARRCRLRPLEPEEIADYIENRLTAASLAGDAFSPHAIKTVAVLSGGVPRTINLLCERSLDIARRRGVTTVDAPVVRSAARQLDIPVPRTWFTRSRAAVVGSAMLVMLVPAAWLCASVVRASHAPATSTVAPAGNPGGGGASATVAPAASAAAAVAPIPVIPGDSATVGTLALADGFTIEVAGFRDVDRATSVIQQLHDSGLPAFHRMDANGLRHFVLVGPYVTQTEVDAVKQMLAARGFTQTKVRREDAGVLLP
ncbi:MAG TPA: AAA family ATPase [Vicinamibacterales bacterium]|jgi:general secretion pathway protein A|nr:AAA family ATPase [Vicinamibacterales bacterium]